MTTYMGYQMAIKTKPLPSPDEIKEYLRYDPATGDFIWIKSPTNRIRVGEKAGTRKKDGYVEIRLSGESYLAHRLAWVVCNGEIPSGMIIDHIQGMSNAISNLRLSTQMSNCHNQRMPRSNTSGYKGVAYYSKLDKWVAYITLDYKRRHLGYFDTPEAAYEVVCKERSKLHGEFARF